MASLESIAAGGSASHVLVAIQTLYAVWVAVQEQGCMDIAALMQCATGQRMPSAVMTVQSMGMVILGQVHRRAGMWHLFSCVHKPLHLVTECMIKAKPEGLPEGVRRRGFG